jgi:hypothetical protein
MCTNFLDQVTNTCSYMSHVQLKVSPSCDWYMTYFQVVREVLGYTQNFRVLALSATPGDGIKVCFSTFLLYIYSIHLYKSLWYMSTKYSYMYFHDHSLSFSGSTTSDLKLACVQHWAKVWRLGWHQAIHTSKTSGENCHQTGRWTWIL